MPRVGLLIGSSFPTMVEAFRHEVRQLGYVEGQDLVLEMRLSRPHTNDLASHVQELAAMDLDFRLASDIRLGGSRARSHNVAPIGIGAIADR